MEDERQAAGAAARKDFGELVECEKKNMVSVN